MLRKNMVNTSVILFVLTTISGCKEVLRYIGLGDFTSPSVVSVIPRDGTTNIAVNTKIIAIFSEPMNEATTEGAFSIIPDIAGTVAWAKQSTVLTFTAQANLSTGTMYTVTISTLARDLSDNNLNNAYACSFTTGSIVDSIPPADVTSFRAVAGDARVDLAWVNPTDVDFAAVKIVYKTTGYPNAPDDGTLVYFATGTSFTHTLLTNGTTYYYRAYTYDTANNNSPGVTAIALPSPTPNALMETFDTYTTGDPPVPPWTEYYFAPGGVIYTRAEAEAMGVTIRIDDAVYRGSSGKSLHFLDASGAGSVGSSTSRGFEQASHVVLEYYMRSSSQSYEGAFVYFGGNIGGEVESVSFRPDGYIGVFTRYAWVTNLLQYTTSTWYYVRRELNLTTGSGDFYVEEAGNPSNSAFYQLGPDTGVGNTYLDLLVIDTSNSQGADCYIDDIVVTY